MKVQNTPKTVPLGKITIRKKIKEEDITWAHGNPTFFFVAEGKDLSGCVELAAATAGVAIQSVGATTGVTSRSQVEEHLQKYR